MDPAPPGLLALNERIGELEQNYSDRETTKTARKDMLNFFEIQLSDNLISCRARGKVGKSGQE